MPTNKPCVLVVLWDLSADKLSLTQGLAYRCDLCQMACRPLRKITRNTRAKGQSGDGLLDQAQAMVARAIGLDDSPSVPT